MEDIKVRAKSAPWWGGVEFVAFSDVGELNSVGKYIVFEQQEQSMLMQPTFILSIDKAQVLMDDLWNSGIRPTEGTGSAGALKAVENHLQDMRKLLFNKEGIK